MKKFGIWLALLVILLAAGGMMLASRLVVIRSAWQKKTDEGKAKVVKLREKAIEEEKKVDSVKKDLQLAIHGWERYWNAPQVVKGGQPGTIIVALGTSQGLVKNAIVYAFQPSADGSSYVGAFKVSEAQEMQAALTPNWRLRVDEQEMWDKSWRYGPNWRFRQNIPRDHKTQFADFEMMMLKKDELLAEQQKHLALQQNAKTKAEGHLKLRMDELNGDPNRAQENLDKYLIEGYHKAVADLEIARNRSQAEVDELRRQVKRSRDEIGRLTQENERLADEGAGEVPHGNESEIGGRNSPGDV